MKKFLLLTVMMVFVTSVAYGLGSETIFNRVYTDSDKTLRVRQNDLVSSATNTRQYVLVPEWISIVSSDTSRKHVRIQIISSEAGVYLNLAAPTNLLANTQTGIFLTGDSTVNSIWELPTDAVYTGEISARSAGTDLSESVELLILTY